jgi:hypothetical protein
MQNPSDLATQRDSKNDSIFGARREIQRRTTLCTEPAWAHQNSKAIAHYAKTPGKTFGFVADRTGTELLGVFSNVFLRIRKVLKASRWLQDT